MKNKTHDGTINFGNTPLPQKKPHLLNIVIKIFGKLDFEPVLLATAYSIRTA